MKEYLSHFSAANYWDIPNLDDLFGAEYMNKYRHGQVVEISVTNPSLRWQKKECIVHLCKSPLPRGATIKCGKNFVASPELLFLELANKVEIHRLILFGLQMCSHPPGDASKAISTKRKLGAFLEKTSGHHGHIRAERALKYIENGSASLMESIAFMILTLPHSYGGFGLNGARFNQEISLDTEARQRLGQTRCFVDLYYAKEKLAIEYDSFAYHNSPSAQGKDLLRAVTLERQGINVMRFGTIQLYDKNACKNFAGNLASRLGKRVRIRASGFHIAHNSLRELLPSK